MQEKGRQYKPLDGFTNKEIELVQNIIDNNIEIKYRYSDFKDGSAVFYFNFNKNGSFLFSVNFSVVNNDDNSFIKIERLNHQGKFPFHYLSGLPEGKKYYALATILLKNETQEVFNKTHKPLNILEYVFKNGELNYKDIDDIASIVVKELDYRKQSSVKNHIYTIIENNKEDYIPSFNHIYNINNEWYLKGSPELVYLDFYEDAGLI